MMSESSGNGSSGNNGKSGETRQRKVVILGLDGATLDLIKPWADAGLMPTFKRLMEQGAYGKLRSTIPPITPAAWSSFITGVNPGKHSVFDFTGHKDDSYDLYMVKSSNRQAPSLWQLASQAGHPVAVFNVPVTYPPERVDGVMVSGLMTPPTAKDASWPPELQKELQVAVPEWGILNEGIYKRGREVEFVGEIMKVNETTFGVASYLMKRQPWDLFVTVFQTSDLIAHFMWRQMETKGADAPEPTREVVANAMQNCYRDLDVKLGKLIEEAGKDCNVIVLSDHGHGRMDNYFAVNTWLLAKGYIKLKQNVSTRLKSLLYRLHFTPSNLFWLVDKFGFGSSVRRVSNKKAAATKQQIKRIFLSFDDIDWSRTRAYSTGYCGPIYVNLKGRDQYGVVNPGKEYDELLDALSADLRTLKEPGTGMPFVGEIHRGRDIYSGPYAHKSPDLVFFPRDWKYMVLGVVEFLSNNWIGKSIEKTGHHRMDGIVFLAGPGIRPGYEISGASITDIAPTALALLGVPVPEGMDGHVLEDAIIPEIRVQLAVTYTGGNGAGPDLVAVPEMSAEDEEILLTRLRNLGYLG